MYSLTYISFELKWLWCYWAFCILFCWLDINGPAENSSKDQVVFRMTRWKESETPYRRTCTFAVLYPANRLLDKLESSLSCVRRKWQPTPVFLSGESRGQRSLENYSPWDRRIRHSWSDLAPKEVLNKVILYHIYK